MNPHMKQRIDKTLNQLSDLSGAQILSFAEFLASKESKRNSTHQETLAAEEKIYLSGIEGGLSEWSSAADEDAYRDL